MNDNCTNRLGEYFVFDCLQMGNFIMVSVPKGHVHFLFANLRLFLLIEMTFSFLLNLVACKVTLYLTILSAETLQR